MIFEYDPVKSVANKAKHGIDFEQAQGLWDDPWLLSAPARTSDEPRLLLIGAIAGKHLGGNLCSSREQCADHLGAPRSQRGDQPL